MTTMSEKSAILVLFVTTSFYAVYINFSPVSPLCHHIAL